MKGKRETSEIIRAMQNLLTELSSRLGVSANSAALTPVSSTKAASFSGPSGGIRLLLEEGFFKEPKTLPQVYERLRQEGFNYRRQVVSVALLRLVRDRTMVRIPTSGEGKEKWTYAERK